MTDTLVLIDYGSGNIRSAEKALAVAAANSNRNVTIKISHRPEDVLYSDRLVLPGVGAFGDCAAGLRATSGLWDAIQEKVTNGAAPFLGICVGMQLMAHEGLEYGRHKGFGWIDGTVSVLEPKNTTYKIPHMGWNSLNILRPHPLFEGIEEGSHVYFTHSFAMTVDRPEQEFANTDHGDTITAVVAKGTAVGTQFHPEKSQSVGLKLLQNFLEWTP